MISINLKRGRGIVLLFYVLFAISLVLVHLVVELFPYVPFFFGLTASTPWGILTSIFIQRTLQGLVTNLTALALIMISMLLIVEANNYKSPINVSLLFCIAPFLLGMLVNYIHMLISPDVRLIGASGVVYGMLAVTFVASIHYFVRSFPNNLHPSKVSFLGIRADRNIVNFFPWALTIGVVLGYPSNQWGDPALVHDLGLLFGLAVSLTYFFTVDGP